MPSMLTTLALAVLFLGAGLLTISPVLGVPVILLGFLCGAAAFDSPGDVEWFLGVLLIMGMIGWPIVQLGAWLGLWSP